MVMPQQWHQMSPRPRFHNLGTAEILGVIIISCIYNRIFSSIPGLYPLDATLFPDVTLKVSLLLLLSHFIGVWLCATPQMAAHQAPSSLGFSRQEHWSGLPFPSPMHESEKSKWSHSVVSDSWRPHGLHGDIETAYQASLSMGFSRKSTGVGCHCLLHLAIYSLS